MKTSITSETVSQQTICGDAENLSLEITRYTEPNWLEVKKRQKLSTLRTIQLEQEEFTVSTFYPRNWLV